MEDLLHWLHEQPLFLSFLLVVSAFVVPTLLGTHLLQPYFAKTLRNEREANTIAGVALSTVSLFYAVLLGLLSLAVFQNYTYAGQTTELEAASIIALGRNADMYPAPVGDQIRSILIKYVDEETGPGWQMQKDGKASPEGASLVDDLAHLLQGFNPGTTGEQALHDNTLRLFSDFVDRRQQRIDASETNIPGILWFVVLTGAVVNAVTLWLFDLDRQTHFVIGSCLSLFIGIIVYMLAMLDQPFSGYLGLLPDSLISARHQLPADRH
jgi:energy-coupling factor transporter transmembrane protein EcfT